MEYSAGIDVPLEVVTCVADAGKIFRETRVMSEPKAFVDFFRLLAVKVNRIGLEAGHCHSGCTPD
jgi:transposase